LAGPITFESAFCERGRELPLIVDYSSEPILRGSRIIGSQVATIRSRSKLFAANVEGLEVIERDFPLVGRA
jgi:hypothetical protein